MVCNISQTLNRLVHLLYSLSMSNMLISHKVKSVEAVVNTILYQLYNKVNSFTGGSLVIDHIPKKIRNTAESVICTYL